MMVVCFLLARNKWIGSHYSPVRITDVTTITHHNNPRALHYPTLHPTPFGSPSPAPSSSQAPFFAPRLFRCSSTNNLQTQPARLPLKLVLRATPVPPYPCLLSSRPSPPLLLLPRLRANLNMLMFIPVLTLSFVRSTLLLSSSLPSTPADAPQQPPHPLLS